MNSEEVPRDSDMDEWAVQDTMPAGGRKSGKSKSVFAPVEASIEAVPVAKEPSVLLRTGDSSTKLVSYLQKTGSILALAEVLDDADDDVADEDMRLLQEYIETSKQGRLEPKV